MVGGRAGAFAHVPSKNEASLRSISSAGQKTHTPLILQTTHAVCIIVGILLAK